MANVIATQRINVDEIAIEKVQEIEKSIDAEENPKLGTINSWFSILKQIITAADLHRTNEKNGEISESIYADYVDDNEQFNAIDLTEQFASNSVKWTIRVRAFKLVHRLVQISSRSNSIIKHLPDLIRLSFVAATSPYDDLKIQGFEMFKFLINKFASFEEEEFPGHSILDQYRTQVLSALRPAFNLDAPPYITAIASQVCCSWICHGQEKEQTNLKRTFQLMLTTIDKLESQNVNQNSKLYTESELEQERLDILGSWAQLYIFANELDSKMLIQLVVPYIDSLKDKWWSALKDYALLIMPAPRIISTQHDNEHVYTREVALRLFEPVWHKLVLAVSIWLSNHCDKYNDKYFKFVCGIIMKELSGSLSNNRTEQDKLPSATASVIRSLNVLLKCNRYKSTDLALVQELYITLYNILINNTKDRGHCRAIVRDSLEVVFNLVVREIADKPEFICYSLAYLIESTSEDFRKADQNFKIDNLKLNSSIKMCNIMSIVKIAPQMVFHKHEFREALLQLFQTILLLKADFSHGLNLLDSLKTLYENLTKEDAAFFIKGLANTKSAVMTILFAPGEDDQTLYSVVLEAYLKSLINDIILSDGSTREELMTIYVIKILEAVTKMDCRSLEKGNALFTYNKNLLGLVIRFNQELSKSYPVEYQNISTPEMNRLNEQAMKLQLDTRPSVQAKPNPQPISQPQSANMTKKTPARIVLKADFSNFYAKNKS